MGSLPGAALPTDVFQLILNQRIGDPLPVQQVGKVLY